MCRSFSTTAVMSNCLTHTILRCMPMETYCGMEMCKGKSDTELLSRVALGCVD